MEIKLIDIICDKNLRITKELEKGICKSGINIEQTKGITVVCIEKRTFSSDKYELKYFIYFYHLYYLAKISQMFPGGIDILYLLTINIPDTFGKLWSIIKMNFID